MSQDDRVGRLATTHITDFFWRGHTSAIRALAVHGRIAISGSYDCSVRVWDVEKGKLLWTLEGHTQKGEFYLTCSRFGSRAQLPSFSLLRCIRCSQKPCLLGIYGFNRSRVEFGRRAVHWGARRTYILGRTPQHFAKQSCIGSGERDIENMESKHKRAEVHPCGAYDHCRCHDDDKMLTTSGTSGESLLLWNTRDGTVIRDMWPEVGGQKVWQVALEGLRCVAASTSTEATFIDIWTLRGEEHIEHSIAEFNDGRIDLGEGRRDIDGDIVVRGFVVVPRPTTHEGA